ncbi:MAG: PspC domain-containing protein, partial [Propionicimonas sp.]|nr:PspC domain-containing protein [Propionicimonas sp.]
MNLPVRRTRDNAVIAGVCAGLARRWNVDPNLLRIALVLACLASGLGLVVYGVAVLVLPTDGSTQPPVHRILPFTRNWPLPAVVAGLGVSGFVLFGIAGGWSGLGFLPVVVALVIWYAASRRRSQGRTTTADPTPFERAAEAWRNRLVEHQVDS